MFYFFKIVFFLFSIIAALGGIYHLLFFRNESVLVSFGYGAGIMLVYSSLVLLWRYLYKLHKTGNIWDLRLRLLGYITTAVPAFVFVLIVLMQTFYLVEAKIFTSMTVISAYKEEAITWHGFDSPTGLKITLTLDHPVSIPGHFRYPKIIMGKNGESLPKDIDSAYWKYCGKPVLEDSSCLTTPIWPMKPFPKLAEDGPTTVTFELFPSNMYYIENENKVCVRRRNPYSDTSFVGLNKIALLHFLGNEHKLEMTKILTETIRKESKILKDIEVVQKIYRNAESGSFLAAGYQGCEIKKAIPFTDEAECFCKEPVKKPEKESEDNKKAKTENNKKEKVKTIESQAEEKIE